MGTFETALAEEIRNGHELVMRLAQKRVDDAGLDLAGDELEQIVNGFETLLLESLEGSGTETRAFFVETAIPALVAAGKATPDRLAGAIAGWAALLSVVLVARVPEAEREAATAWLSTFFDDYAEAAVRAAREAS